jgi:hypothetical protein
MFFFVSHFALFLRSLGGQKVSKCLGLLEFQWKMSYYGVLHPYSESHLYFTKCVVNGS